MKFPSRTVSAIVILLLPLVGILVIYVFISGESKSFTGLETIFKIVALYAAFWFFLYKLITGWLIINLNISLETERSPSNDNESDHLVIHIILNKGATDSVWLNDIFVLLRRYENIPDEATLHTIPDNPTLIKPIGYRRSVIENNNWMQEPGNRKLTISPGEETRFSAYTLVKKNEIVALEVLVLGTRPFYSMERPTNEPIQWKASKIVLPIA